MGGEGKGVMELVDGEGRGGEAGYAMSWLEKRLESSVHRTALCMCMGDMEA